jgi:phosphoribosyl-AMP cyclohydrolase
MAVDAQALWAKLKTDGAGLVTAVVQHHRSGAVLMVGHMNAEALARTLERGRVTFWSRSRDQLWEKGESSGHTLALRGMWVDCDGDALLVQAEPQGPTCHTGAASCFFTSVLDPEISAAPAQVLERVFAEICARKAGLGITSADRQELRPRPHGWRRSGDRRQAARGGRRAGRGARR